MSAALWALAVLVLAFMAARLLGLEHGFVPVVLVAYTPYAVVVAVVVVVVCAWRQRWWAALVAAVATAGLALAVVPRALPDDQRRNAEGAELIVASANMALGEGSPRDLVGLVRDHEVDVLAVEELTPDLARALDEEGLHDLLPVRMIMPARHAEGSGLYSRLPLSALEPVPAQVAGRQTPRASVAVAPGLALDIAVAHPTPPAGPDQMSQWQVGLAALPEASPRGDLRLVAGDFNATLDHADLRRLIDTGYSDAADVTGEGLWPTWPSALFPPPVTIDHVLADGRISVEDYETQDIEGSDHEAVVTGLRLPAEK